MYLLPACTGDTLKLTRYAVELRKLVAVGVVLRVHVTGKLKYIKTVIKN
jgi:hypothetical protein